MKNVLLNMKDLKTNELISREISGLNAYSSGAVCWELRGENEQRKNLERWIKERGNDQHATKLELLNFRFVEL